MSCPTRYQAESSSINLRRSIRYGLGVLATSGQYQLHKHGLHRYPYLDFDPEAVLERIEAIQERAAADEQAQTAAGEQSQAQPESQVADHA